jgi:hypothetical protein
MKALRRGGLRAAIVVLGVGLAGCSATRHTISPYRDDPTRAEAIEGEAVARCRTRGRPVPPAPFTTDGCSAWPDGSWGPCCVAHDMDYWCGGSCTDRAAADHALDRCVTAGGHAILGASMGFGVRLGGAPWLPAPWRWGYGWPWPHGYDPTAEPQPAPGSGLQQ